MSSNEKYNPYSNFWNFIAISLFLFKYQEFLNSIFNNEFLGFVIQFALISLSFMYVSPYLAKPLKSYCDRTRINIHILTILYFILYVFYYDDFHVLLTMRQNRLNSIGYNEGFER